MGRQPGDITSLIPRERGFWKRPAMAQTSCQTLWGFTQRVRVSALNEAIEKARAYLIIIQARKWQIPLKNGSDKCPEAQRREQLFPFQTQKRYCSGCCMNTQSWLSVYMVFFRSLLNRSFFQKSAFIIIAASNPPLLWRPKYCISIMIRTTFS